MSVLTLNSTIHNSAILDLMILSSMILSSMILSSTMLNAMIHNCVNRPVPIHLVHTTVPVAVTTTLPTTCTAAWVCNSYKANRLLKKNNGRRGLEAVAKITIGEILGRQHITPSFDRPIQGCRKPSDWLGFGPTTFSLTQWILLRR